MSMSNAILPEFDQEMAKTRTVLERAPQAAFGWKPHQKSWTLMELVNHIARLPEWGTMTMTTESLDLDPDRSGYAPPPPAETREGMLEVFDANAADFRTALAEAEDEAFMTPWTLLNGGEELFTLPRVAVIRSMILNHIIHHRGQLTLYLRLNDVPVPGVYGPSADEGM